jgi:hypothetical protein
VGTPEEIAAQAERSYTGQFLHRVLDGHSVERREVVSVGNGEGANGGDRRRGGSRDGDAGRRRSRRTDTLRSARGKGTTRTT